MLDSERTPLILPAQHPFLWETDFFPIIAFWRGCQPQEMSDIPLSPTHKTGQMAFTRPLDTLCRRCESVGRSPGKRVLAVARQSVCPSFLRPGYTTRLCSHSAACRCGTVVKFFPVESEHLCPPQGWTRSLWVPLSHSRRTLHCWQHCCTGSPAVTV